MARDICCLGIESTAHTFGASVIKNQKILSNVKKSFTTNSGGMIPYQVADHHVSICDEVILQSLKNAKITIKDVELIAFSKSPGLGPMLRIGAMVARSLASLHDIDIIGVNHCIAHLEIGRFLTKSADPILLYASGANTQIIAYDEGRYRIFGETLDIGVGNFLDQLARELNLGFPGGPIIGKLSQKYRDDCKKNNIDPEYIEFPYNVKGMDISFGGILTNAKKEIKTNSIEKICYSVEETIYAMLCEVSERALAHCNKKELLLGGGVACAKRLQEMAKIMCEERGAKCFVLDPEYNVDNAAMISWTGILMHDCGLKDKISDCGIDPYLRTDEVEVFWRKD